MDNETTELVLANRSFMYALAARGFAAEIDDDFAALLASEHAHAELALVEVDETAAIVSLHEEVVSDLSHEGAVDEAARAYVRLFVGPGTLRADPWETVHLSRKRVLFQPGVLEVREAYREAGFLPVRYREVPDDFIGIELDFMAKLAAKALDEWKAGDDAWRVSLAQAQAFLEGHLLRWAGSLAEAIEREYGACFYSRFARMAALIAKRDAAVLADLGQLP